MSRLVLSYNEALEEFGSFKGSAKQFLEEFPEYSDAKRAKWSSSLVADLQRKKQACFAEKTTRVSLYRPFGKQHAYFDPMWNHRQAQLPSMFPTQQHHNIGFDVMAPREAVPFALLATDVLPDLSFLGPAPGK